MDRTGERGGAGLRRGPHTAKVQAEETPRPPVAKRYRAAASSPSAPPLLSSSRFSTGARRMVASHGACCACTAGPLRAPTALPPPPPLCERLIPAVGPRVCVSCSPPPPSALSPALSSHMYPAYGRLSGRGIERLLTLPQTKRSQAAAATAAPAAGGAW